MESLRYWSLHHPPFAADQAFFSASPQQAAISQISEAISNDTRLTVLSNPGGCGSTSLLKHLSRCAGLNDQALEMVYWDIANVLSRDLEVGSAKIRRFLSNPASEGMKRVWFVDHCSALKLHLVRQLVDQDLNLHAVVGVAFHTFKVVRWGETQVTLSPFSMDETEAYIEHSFRSAGCHQNPFTKSGVGQIHALSGGNAKRIGQIATNAMERFAA